MTLRVALVNANWAKGGDRDLILDACALADVVAVVEAIYRDGKPLPLARWAPEGWTVIHDTRDAGRAGVALLVRDAAATITRHRLVLTTRLSGLRPRYTLLADLVEKPTGEAGTVAVTHFPPPRIVGGRQAHARKLRPILATSPAVLLGADVNMRPDAAGDLLGLETDSAEVMAWLWSEHVRLDRVKPVKHPGSDHPIATARVRFPVKEAPVAYRYLTNLADVCRAAGLKVVEVDGWQTRGRPSSTGGFDPVGVGCHHTATGPTTSDAAVVRLLVNGRSDLPGPLCQLGLARDGTVYVIAAGRANHGGKAKASGTVAAGDANRLYIGIEAFNDGRGEPWPRAQYDAYVRLAAALCQGVTGNSVQTVRGHKEWSVTGKIDPTFNMDTFRADVAAAMAPTAPKTAPKRHPKFIRQELRHLRALRKKAKAAGKKVRAGRLGKLIRTARDLFPKR